MPEGPDPQFETIIDTHWGSVFGLARRMTGDRNEAEEITQHTFYLAYRAWPSFEHRSRVSTWLFRIAVNACKRHMIAKRRDPVVSLEHAPPPTSHDDDPIESREQRERLDAAMQAIRPKHRVVLTLFCLEELDHQAIAEILDCPVGTVWSRLYHARAELARQLGMETEG